MSSSDEEPLSKRLNKRKHEEEEMKVKKEKVVSDEEIPLSKRIKTIENGKEKQGESKVKVKKEKEESDEEDIPLSKKMKALKNGEKKEDEKKKTPEVKKEVKKEPKKEVKVKKESSSSSELSSESDSDDMPLAKRQAAKKEKVEVKKEPVKKEIKKEPVKKEPTIKKEVTVKKEPIKKETPKKVKKEEKSDSEDDLPLKVKLEKKKEESTPPVVKKEDEKPRRRKKEENEDETVYKWWLEDKGKANEKEKEEDEDGDDEDEDDEDEDGGRASIENDGQVKWTTLQHSGVLFPPLYSPHNVNLIYNGEKIHLEPEAEEIATFFAAIVDTDHGKNPVFQKNFFRDFMKILKKCKKKYPIKEFEKCDFSLIAAHLQAEKERKKNRSKEEREIEKKAKAEIDKQYGIAVVDGRKEKVGNFRIEPPGLFRGRGSHPKTGTLKERVFPEDVTINIGKEAVVPAPPPGHKWNKVIHDNTVTWLATWTDNVNGQIKYVYLAANSSLKGKSDMKKYDKARKLKDYIGKIRAVYTAELKDQLTVKRQTATALYLIDKLALRAGNEKDAEEEADTVGCCSLRVEHIKLIDPNTVVFDFLGKDSMRYHNQVVVDPAVYKNLFLFQRGNKGDPKKEGDMLFDKISTVTLNKHLSSLMPGLTAKVFRTFNASITFQAELNKTEKSSNIQELVLSYNRANRQAAILCNHQRTVPKTFDNSMAKLKEKLMILKYQRRITRKQILDLDKKKKKEIPTLKDEESDFDDDKEKEIGELVVQREQEKEDKKLEKLKEEAEKKGETFEPPAKKEKREPTTVDGLIKKFVQIEATIEKTRLEMTDKDENKATALGTSKINYLDPRISVAWCKKHGVPLEKIFTKSLREKFRWAWDSADENWQF